MSFFPDLAIGIIGSPIPAYAELSGGSDGTNLQALLTDVNGQLKVLVQNFPATQAVTQSTTPWVDNITKWNGTALGNPSNWGDTAPTGNVIGVNAAIFSGNQPIGSTGDALRVSVSNFPGIFVVRGSLTQNNAAPSASTNLGVLPAVANAAAPTYVEGNQVLLSTDLTGALRVNVSAITAATVNQGNQGTAAQGWFVELTDGTNVLGTSSHPLRIDPTGTTTQPVSLTSTTISGTVAVTQSTSPWVISFTSPQHVIVDSGTVTANQGTSPWVVSLTSTTITGTVAVTQSTSPWTIQGDSASGASKAGNPVQIGGVFNTTQPTVTTGQTVESQFTARGAQIVATGVDTFNVTINSSLPAGTNVIGHVITDSGSTTVVTGTVAVTQSTSPWVVSLSSTTITGNVSIIGTDADNATNSTTKLPVIVGRANASAPSWTEGHEVPLSTDLAGNLRVVDITLDLAVASASGFVNAPNNAIQIGGIVSSTGKFVAYSADADNSTNSTAKLPVIAGRANASAPSWTEGHEVPLSTDLAGNVRVTLNAETVKVIGAVNQGTSPWVMSLSSTTITGNVNVVGTDADNATNSTKKLPVIAGTANAAAPSWTEGHEVPLSSDLSGNLRTLALISGSTSSAWNVPIWQTPQPTVLDVNANVLGIPYGVPPAYVTGTVATSTGTSLSFGSSLQPAAGNAIVVAVQFSTAVSAVTCVDNNSNALLSSNSGNFYLFYGFIQGSGTFINYTLHWTTSATASVSAAVYTNVSAFGPFSSITTGTNTNPDTSNPSNHSNSIFAMGFGFTDGTGRGVSAVKGILRINENVPGPQCAIIDNMAVDGQTDLLWEVKGLISASETWTAIALELIPAGVPVSLAGNVTVNQGTSPWVVNVSQWAGSTLGAPQNFGVNPGAVLVGSVNASIFAGATPLTASAGGFLNVQIANTSVPVNPVQTTTGNGPTFTTVGVTSATAVASNASRKGLLLVNTSANTISLGLNGNAAILNSGITLYPGGSFEMDDLCFSTGAVTAIASAASSNLAIQEMQ